MWCACVVRRLPRLIVDRRHHLRRCRDSSVGRASDWRSEGPWFKSGELARALNNPGSRHWIFPFPFFLFSRCQGMSCFFFQTQKNFSRQFHNKHEGLCSSHRLFAEFAGFYGFRGVSKVFYSRSCDALSHTRLNRLPFFALICSPQSSFPVYLRRR